MATATYIQRGESLDYVNSGESAIAVGTVVVLGTHIGVAGDTIAAGAKGSVHVTGVFKFPKAASDGGITLGQSVVWDNTNSVIAAYDPTANTNTGNGSIIGYAVSAAATAATEVYVKLNG